MNSKKIKALLICLFVLIISFIFLYHSYRYSVTFEMQDIEYKKQIIKDSRNPFYRLENLRSLVGEDELTQFIIHNNDNPDVYSPKQKSFRANLHMHTLNSDGKMSVEELLERAQDYGQTLPPNEYIYVAVTDHNTVNGAKEVIQVLQKYPKRYSKVKVIAGMEIYTRFINRPNRPGDIHVLTWCINPYDKFLNKEYYKDKNAGVLNRTRPDRYFDWVISTMKNYGIVGIAHPARYTSDLKDKKYNHIDSLFDRYVKYGRPGKLLFVEGYYQSYIPYGEKIRHGEDYDKFLDYINTQAKNKHIYKTGGTDAHHQTIFAN